MSDETPIVDDEVGIERQRVWGALSDFWLDTELDAEDLEYVARVLAWSPFSMAELEEIYLWEVAPVVWPNLYNIAGEWAGFHMGWLCDEATKRMRHRSGLLRLMMRLGLARRMMCYASERHWQVMARRVPELRANGPMKDPWVVVMEEEV